jgi:hypothetical protein
MSWLPRMDSKHDKVIQSHQWNIANHVATSNAGVVGGAGANGGCCHANFHLEARSTITSGSGGTPLCGFICTVESGKTGDLAVERLFTGKTWVGLAGVDRWSAQGSAADTWAQNARLRSCRALRACRYDS